jgi:peptide/nickel transport system substrate-binding protein
MVEFTWLISTLGVPRLEEEPLRDLRVRRALYLAVDGKQVIEANPMGLGHGSPNPAVPAAIREWSIPIDQLPPEGRRLYEPDLAEAKRLLAQAGHGGGLRLPVESTASWGPAFSDLVQSILAQWKKAGVETDLKLKEGNAFIASVLGRKYERLAMTLRGGPTTPDFYLFGPHMPGSPQNTAGVNDPRLAEMLKLQRRTFDEKKRREIIYDIQRLCSQQAYYLYVSPSAKVLSAWEPYVKNFSPNISLDYGGRLMIAWLDR